MTPELRAELDRIEEFLMGPQGADLSMVLAALRGPDNDNDTVKECTTTYIRTAAFPRLERAPAIVGLGANAHEAWVMWRDPRGFTTDHDALFARASEGGRPNPIIRSHFIGHVRRAAIVLELMSKED